MFDCLMPTVERFWITLIWRDFCRQAWQRRTLPIQRPATVSTSRWRRTLPKIWATSCTTLTLSPGSTQWWAEHSSMDQSILPHPCRWAACGAPTQASPVNAWPRSWTRSRGASVRRTTRCPGWTRVASSWPSGGKTRQKRWHSRLVLDYGGHPKRWFYPRCGRQRWSRTGWLSCVWRDWLWIQTTLQAGISSNRQIKLR